MITTFITAKPSITAKTTQYKQYKKINAKCVSHNQNKCVKILITIEKYFAASSVH